MNEFLNQYHFLEKELQDEILKIGTFKSYNATDVLIREGQFITYFPLVIKGLIRITRNSEDGNELLLYYLKQNEVCAMSLTCCMTTLKSTVKAIAEEDTEVIMLPVSMLEGWICKYPTWKQYIMQTFQNRFQELIDTVDTFAFMKLDERLLKYFSYRHNTFGTTTYNGTHQDLALQLNTSREVISRLLKKLEKEGKIKISRNFIDFSNLV